MTNQQGAEALAHELYTAAQLAPGEGVLDAVARLAALVEAHQPAAHVLNPAEIEHVADVVSKNGAESNMAQQPAPSAAAAIAGEIELIEKAVRRVGITSLLNHGAASCVFTEGCEGVSQDHLLAYTREIALHCAVALGAHPAVDDMAKELDAARDSLQWYMRRCEQLQRVQHRMRDPERTMVCDILANGSLLVPEGQRYTAPQPSPTPQADSTPRPRQLLAQADPASGSLVGYFSDEKPPFAKRPTPQADSQPAPVRGKLLPCPCCGGEAAEHDRFNSNTVRCLSCGLRVKQSEMGMGDAAKRWNSRAARAPADSVTAPAGCNNIPGMAEKALAKLKSHIDHVAHKDGHWETRHLKDALFDLEWIVRRKLTPTPPTQAADSVLEDAARLDWLESNSQINIERVRYLGATKSIYEVTPYDSISYDGETLRAAIDAARKQGGAT